MGSFVGYSIRPLAMPSWIRFYVLQSIQREPYDYIQDAGKVADE